MSQSFESFGKFNKELIDGVMESTAALTSGMQAIAAQSVDYARTSVESSSSAIEKIVAARSAEKVLELQLDYARSAIEGGVAQVTRVGDICADMAKDTYKPAEAMFNKVK